MTNKTTEALKLAEEALNAMLTHMGMDEDEWTKPTFDQSRKTLAAIREALAEPVQEPVAFKFPREPKPENAMGWTVDYGLIRDIAEAIGDQEFHPGYEGIELTLIALEIIYAAPVSAKREWVELTDYEIGVVMDFGYATDSESENARAVIAAFKEKNK